MTAVLISGYMADDTLWDDMAGALAGIGPLTFFNLNHGDSIVAIAKHALLSCPPQFVLIGFSMGGYVAREMARQAPDRVTALVLIATAASAETQQRSTLKATAVQALSATSFRGLSRVAIAASLHPDHATDAALIARVRDMGTRLGGEAFVSQSKVRRDGDADRLAEIGCPTLVVAAAQDQLRSVEEARELCSGIPDATLKVIENSGHMIPFEQPAALAAAILDWLHTETNQIDVYANRHKTR